jgi:hypothetical protein
MYAGVSKHNIAKPEDHKDGMYVDATGIDKRKKLLPGEVSLTTGWTGRSQQRP